MKRRTPEKVASIKLRIEKVSSAKKKSEFEKEKCRACNGLGSQSAGGDMYGVWTCDSCGGSGKKRKYFTERLINI